MTDVSANREFGGVPRRATAVLALLILVFAPPTSPIASGQERKRDGQAASPERVDKFRERLFRGNFRELEKLGSSANDVYLAVLEDEQSDLFEVSDALILDLLIEQKGNRTQFRPVVRKLVGHKVVATRWRAVTLLGDIGEPADRPTLVRLLTDESTGVQSAAAEALAKIGSPKELKALDDRLVANRPDDTEHDLNVLTIYRDRLRDRLVKEKKIAPPKPPDPPPVDPAELKRVREVLRRTRGFADELRKEGRAPNPVYLVILEDDKAKLCEIDGVLWLVTDQKGDRAQFVPVVGRLLRHRQAEVREYAAILMGDIGGPVDGSLLVPLLSDQSVAAQWHAAAAIAKIGTATELEALDRRLKTKHPADDPDLLAVIKRSRDQLKARLDAAKRQKD